MTDCFLIRKQLFDNYQKINLMFPNFIQKLEAIVPSYFNSNYLFLLIVVLISFQVILL